MGNPARRVPGESPAPSQSVVEEVSLGCLTFPGGLGPWEGELLMLLDVDRLAEDLQKDAAAWRSMQYDLGLNAPLALLMGTSGACGGDCKDPCNEEEAASRGGSTQRGGKQDGKRCSIPARVHYKMPGSLWGQIWPTAS